MVDQKPLFLSKYIRAIKDSPREIYNRNLFLSVCSFALGGCAKGMSMDHERHNTNNGYTQDGTRERHQLFPNYRHSKAPTSSTTILSPILSPLSISEPASVPFSPFR